MAGLFGSDFWVTLDKSTLRLVNGTLEPRNIPPPGELSFAERLGPESGLLVTRLGQTYMEVSGESPRLVSGQLPEPLYKGLVGGVFGRATWFLDSKRTDGQWLFTELGAALSEGVPVAAGSAFVLGTTEPIVVQPLDGRLRVGKPSRDPRDYDLSGWTPTRVMSATRTGSTSSVLVELSQSENLSSVEPVHGARVYGWVSVPEPSAGTQPWMAALLFAGRELQDIAWTGRDTAVSLAVVADGRLAVANLTTGLCWLKENDQVTWTMVAGALDGKILAAGRRGAESVIVEFLPAEVNQ